MDSSVNFNQLLITIIINLVITLAFYLAIPIIIRLGFKKSYSKKDAKKIAIINSIIVFIIFSFYNIAFLQNDKLANVAPAFLWGALAYGILKERNQHNDFNNINCDIKKDNNIIGNDIAVKDMLVKSKRIDSDMSINDEINNLSFQAKGRLKKEKEKENENDLQTVWKIIAIFVIISIVFGTFLYLYIYFTNEISKSNQFIEKLEKENNELKNENNELWDELYSKDNDSELYDAILSNEYIPGKTKVKYVGK